MAPYLFAYDSIAQSEETIERARYWGFLLKTYLANCKICVKWLRKALDLI